MAILTVILTIPSLGNAQDFGKRASVFAIIEQGFVAMMERKSLAINVQAMQKNMQEQAKKQVQNPQAVIGIQATKIARSFVHDPAYTILEDIVLPCGKILHHQGEVINPFDHMQLSKTLLFIDGTNEAQVEWLIARLQQARLAEEQVKIILVKGSPWILQERLGQPVYFDQHGEITSKLGITQVPATVQQEEKKLRIDEIKL